MKSMADWFCMTKPEEFVLPPSGRRNWIDDVVKMGHQVKKREKWKQGVFSKVCLPCKPSHGSGVCV